MNKLQVNERQQCITEMSIFCSSTWMLRGSKSAKFNSLWKVCVFWGSLFVCVCVCQSGCGFSHAAIPRLTAPAWARINSQPSVLPSLARCSGGQRDLQTPCISPSHNVLTSSAGADGHHMSTHHVQRGGNTRGKTEARNVPCVYPCAPLVFVMWQHLILCANNIWVTKTVPQTVLSSLLQEKMCLLLF